MRDVVTIPFDGGASLIIASDNSGGIGMRADDQVQVPYETVAYYSFRVAVMECIAAGGEPITVVLHNFCGNEPWEELVNGIQKGLFELDLTDVPVTGSTESNFQLLQSAIGMLVIGKRAAKRENEISYDEDLNLAVIGLPLVGSEVIDQENQVVPLSVFRDIAKMDGVITWPVGSRGIFYELEQMFPDCMLKKEMVVSDIDVWKSSGPATCFIAAYRNEQADELKKLAGTYMHSLEIRNCR
ncbi:ATP-binding protein [Neobacillus mesonae]|uniref:ATP-binding protein n=1 Tax=Neobacillus mesonae TaxID=1193713 RepID=UPI00203D896D|nr:ATP-binding protein [Neobacillus mesonae]MCM3566964.1 ATP-binding protein [Neobacillus mesonae]